MMSPRKAFLAGMLVVLFQIVSVVSVLNVNTGIVAMIGPHGDLHEHQCSFFLG